MTFSRITTSSGAIGAGVNTDFGTVQTGDLIVAFASANYGTGGYGTATVLTKQAGTATLSSILTQKNDFTSVSLDPVRYYAHSLHYTRVQAGGTLTSRIENGTSYVIALWRRSGGNIMELEKAKIFGPENGYYESFAVGITIKQRYFNELILSSIFTFPSDYQGDLYDGELPTVESPTTEVSSNSAVDGAYNTHLIVGENGGLYQVGASHANKFGINFNTGEITLRQNGKTLRVGGKIIRT